MLLPFQGVITFRHVNPGCRIVESPRPVRAKALILKYIRLVVFYAV